MQSRSLSFSTDGRQQMIQEHTGGIGTAVTASTGVVGFITDALPVLQAISLIVSVVVGLLTAAWYIRKFIKAR